MQPSFMIMITTVMLASSCATARTERISILQLERRLEAATKSAPGIVFGALWRDGTTIRRSAGSADLRAGKRLTDVTPFAWFSVTKLFSATAVMQLAERGHVDLDSPVSRYLPEVRLRGDGREATVRQLLAHTAGLPNPIPVSWVHLADEPTPALDEMIRVRVGPAPELDSAPGTKSAYSNLGYLLLGHIVERASGERFERYVEAHVLEPL